MSHGSLLLPTPRRLTSTGRLLPIDADSIAVVARIDPTLPREGYRLRVRVRGGRAEARVEAAADAGVKHAKRTLAALTTPDRRAVEEVDVNDWPAFAWRGILEGFYGPPWSHEDRLCPLRLAAACKMSAYGYAPKNDPGTATGGGCPTPTTSSPSWENSQRWPVRNTSSSSMPSRPGSTWPSTTQMTVPG